MELKDTAELMLSADYKEKFKAEYWQLKNRYEKLQKAYNDGSLADKETPQWLFKEQLNCMELYLETLTFRSKFEEIDL